MKKRVLAVVLAAVLLVCAAPFSFAMTAEEPEEPKVSFELSLLNQLTGARHSHHDTRTTLAVGDTIRVWYQGEIPADFFLNGEAAHHFRAGSAQTYDYVIKSTDPVAIVLRTADKELLNRSFTVISSAEMYRQTLKEALDIRESIEALKYGAMHGFPVGNPFVYPLLIASQIGYILQVLFSFPKIKR